MSLLQLSAVQVLLSAVRSYPHKDVNMKHDEEKMVVRGEEMAADGGGLPALWTQQLLPTPNHEPDPRPPPRSPPPHSDHPRKHVRPDTSTARKHVSAWSLTEGGASGGTIRGRSFRRDHPSTSHLSIIHPSMHSSSICPLSIHPSIQLMKVPSTTASPQGLMGVPTVPSAALGLFVSE